MVSGNAWGLQHEVGWHTAGRAHLEGRGGEGGRKGEDREERSEEGRESRGEGKGGEEGDKMTM